jgi:hypothetical protein
MRLKRNEDTHVCNTSYGTVNTEITIPKVLLIPLLKMSLRVTMYKAHDEVLEAENTE